MPSTKFDWRSKHRDRAHAEAHNEADPAELAIPDHVDAPRGQAELLTTADELTKLLAELRAAGSFAYDSEFIGESSYQPRLCLIQVATAAKVSLIDPMAPGLGGDAMLPFWELLCDASVEKIVHAGQQDVEPVVRFTGRGPANVLDTQIAAGFCAMAYPTSLAKLVLETTGVPLQKGFTFTDWSARPLSAKQLRYAADDVRYLPAVAVEIKKRLAKSGHADWVQAECDAMCDASLYGFNPETAVEKVRGAGSCDARQLNVLAELVVWRDAAAREADLPARAYLRDETMIDLAKAMPKTADKLAKIRGLPRPTIEQYGETLVALVVRGCLAPTAGVQTLRGHEPTPRERFAADALWAAAQAICINQSIDPAAVTSRGEIGELHRHLAKGTDASTLRVMTGWRRAALGGPLLGFWNDGAVVSLARG